MAHSKSVQRRVAELWAAGDTVEGAAIRAGRELGIRIHPQTAHKWKARDLPCNWQELRDEIEDSTRRDVRTKLARERSSIAKTHYDLGTFLIQALYKATAEWHHDDKDKPISERRLVPKRMNVREVRDAAGAAAIIADLQKRALGGDSVYSDDDLDNMSLEEALSIIRSGAEFADNLEKKGLLKAKAAVTGAPASPTTDDETKH